MECSRCKSTESLFINSKPAKPNHNPTYMCRKCNTKRAIKYRATENGMKKIREAVYRSIEKHKEKQLARYEVYKATLRGDLIRPTVCPVCGIESKIQAHHKDYDKPLDVKWMCVSCHSQEHKNAV